LHPAVNMDALPPQQEDLKDNNLKDGVWNGFI
jgi:hypothetical protein